MIENSVIEIENVAIIPVIFNYLNRNLRLTLGYKLSSVLEGFQFRW